MRALVAALLVTATALPAFADQTGGTLVKFDAAKNTLTLSDRTVWILPAGTALPEQLAEGDKLAITYVSAADNGWTKILRIERVKG